MAAPSAITEQQMAEVAFMAGLIRETMNPKDILISIWPLHLLSVKIPHLQVAVVFKWALVTWRSKMGLIFRPTPQSAAVEFRLAQPATLQWVVVLCPIMKLSLVKKTSLAVAFTLVTVRTISLASPAERSRTTAQRTLAAASRSQQVLPCLLPTVPFKEIPVGPKEAVPLQTAAVFKQIRVLFWTCWTALLLTINR